MTSQHAPTASSTPVGPPGRRPGRPRRPDVEPVVLDAAIALLNERGLDDTSMSAVIKRSGVARATVFRRWPNRQALITDAIRRAMGRPVMTASGDLEDDLRRGTTQILEALSLPSFRRIFPALVAGLTTADDESARLSFDELAPGRPIVAAAYRQQATEQGFRPDIDGNLVVDILIGAHIGYLLAAGSPPSSEVSARVLDVVLNGLRQRPAEVKTVR